MAEFHFLRPFWLLLLPLILWLAWRTASGRGRRGGWHDVVEIGLQPFVLASSEVLRDRRWPVLLAGLAAALAVIALAGPTWDRLPVPAYRSNEALVVALDLSRSMDAGDVEPSRLARAKIKLLSLLERRASGQTALVVFSAHAFTVTPLTTDTRTIASLVGSLNTDIMPSRGSYVEAGLNKAASLMRQTGLNQGEILLVSDADVSPQAVDVAQSLRREGYRIDVLAVGTEDGAPIPEAEGGFLTDKSGQVVVPRLDTAGLKRLASVGGGRYAQLTPNDRDLDALFSAEAIGALAGESDEDPYQADIWRDQGIWLTLALLPLVALAFRRGWIYLLIAGIVLPLPRAEAFEWSDLWQRPDQQGLSAFQSDAPAEAAKLFDDPQWRAAARYRAGDFKGSASSLAGIDTAEAQYNRGNGLARSGALEEAVAAYDRALALDPGHEDAAYNREIVADLLEQQKQEQEQQQQEQQQEQGEQSEDQGEQASDQSEQSESEGGQDEQNQQSSQASNDDRQGRDDQQQSDDAQSQDQSDDEQQADAEQQPEQSEPDEQQSLQASAVPEDVEEWASEQAADQWLRRIPQDPGGLLRRKFLYQYQRLGVDQDGNYVWPGDEQQPW